MNLPKDLLELDTMKKTARIFPPVNSKPSKTAALFSSIVSAMQKFDSLCDGTDGIQEKGEIQ